MDIKGTTVFFKETSCALSQIQKSAVEASREKADPTLSINHYQNESGNHFPNPELICETDQRNDQLRKLLRFWCACENAKARILHVDGVL